MPRPKKLDDTVDAVVSVKFALVFNIGGEGVHDPRSVIENAVNYLQTLLEFERDDQLQAATGLQVAVLDTYPA
jgi:hypothetical protein